MGQVIWEQEELQAKQAISDANKLSAWASVFSKVNVMMVGKKLPVIVGAIGFPSATDFDKVYWDYHLIPSALQDLDSEQEIALIQGIDFHEIGHVLFSPGPGTELGDYIFKSDNTVNQTSQHMTHKMIWNILEDQRMEMLLVALYPSFIPYLTMSTKEFVINHKPDNAHALLWGRKYFPKSLREEFRNSYVNDWIVEDADTVAKVIDEWCRLDSCDNANFNKAMKILNSLHFTDKVMDDIQKGNMPKIQCGISHFYPDSEGNQATPGEFEDAQGKLTVLLNADEDGVSGKKGGKTGTGDHGATLEDLMKALSKFSDSLLGASDVRLDIQGLRKQFRREVEIQKSQLRAKQSSSTEMPVDAIIRQTSTSIAQYLQELRHLLAPTWQRRQPTGRINVRQYYDASPGNLDVFDTWNPGREEDASLETCILVDMSSSMSPYMKEVSELLWLTKRSMDLVDIPTTVIGFDTQCFKLYGREEKVASSKLKLFREMGGTDPTEAFKEARKVLLSSPAKHRLLITITDGEWSYIQENSQQVKEMTDAGVMTVLFGYDAWGTLLDKDETRGHSIGRNVKTLHGLPTFVRDKIVTVMQEVAFA